MPIMVTAKKSWRVMIEPPEKSAGDRQSVDMEAYQQQISFSGKYPSTKRWTWPSTHSSLVFHCRQRAPTAFASCASTWFCKQCQASVRYIAPVSTWMKPNALATRFALVLLPLALVPSMAMTTGCIMVLGWNVGIEGAKSKSLK